MSDGQSDGDAHTPKWMESRDIQPISRDVNWMWIGLPEGPEEITHLQSSMGMLPGPSERVIDVAEQDTDGQSQGPEHQILIRGSLHIQLSGGGSGGLSQLIVEIGISPQIVPATFAGVIVCFAKPLHNNQ